MPAPADRRRPTTTSSGEGEKWSRTYRDHAGEALSGEVVFYPVGRLGPITVELVEGEASVMLPPGTYTVAERLESAQGVELPYGGSYSVTIGA